eukprot:6182448-Pyramimonas_sp.AAC.1
MTVAIGAQFQIKTARAQNEIDKVSVRDQTIQTEMTRLFLDSWKSRCVSNSSLNRLANQVNDGFAAAPSVQMSRRQSA